MAVKQTKLIDFGKRSGLKVYPVSMGTMRFPESDDEAVSLIRTAIDAGIIYLDTGRGYGDSELKLAKALKDGYREKVILSTKWCPWVVKIEPDDSTSAECTYKRILESMERLEVEKLDFYQIWNVDSLEHYKAATAKGGMLDGIMRAKDEGLISHTGFTTHDTPENISKYIEEADWCEAILFTYNIINPTYRDVIAQAHRKGIATIVMNPMGGGTLAENSPVLKETVNKVLGNENIIETAHRYLASNENIDTILCGISKPSDITSTIENYSKPALPPAQQKKLEEAMDKISSKGMGFCVDCKYCLPCPEGIDIPTMMRISYLSRFLKLKGRPAELYSWQAKSPSVCTACGKCEAKCTQKLKIIEEMKYLLDKFGKKD
jgi:uncharacterized protein